MWYRGSRVYICARHRHRDNEEMDEMCDKNSIFACFDAMITQKSHDHPGYRSWFHFSFDHDVAHAFWRRGKQWRWQHVQPLRVHAIQNTRSTIVVESQQKPVKLIWRYKWILNWYEGLLAIISHWQPVTKPKRPIQNILLGNADPLQIYIFTVIYNFK